MQIVNPHWHGNVQVPSEWWPTVQHPALIVDIRWWHRRVVTSSPWCIQAKVITVPHAKCGGGGCLANPLNHPLTHWTACLQCLCPGHRLGPAKTESNPKGAAVASSLPQSEPTQHPTCPDHTGAIAWTLWASFADSLVTTFSCDYGRNAYLFHRLHENAQP